MFPKTPKAKHDHDDLKFPDGFLWGTSTSAHQVEGNNTNSDWWAWEQQLPPKNRSGQACDQYNLFEQDFKLAKDLNHNAHRLSIEWARIEPSNGVFDQTEIDHYKKVLKSLKDKDIKVMLTLWHFTLPQWVADQGGWENSKTVKYFIRFVEKVAPEIREYVDFWVILNEPDIYAYQAYISKEWPGNHGGTLGYIRTYWNLAQAYKKAYHLLHKLTPKIPAGLAQNIQSYQATHKHSLAEQFSVMVSDGIANHLFYFLTKGCHDFIGVNYYFHWRYTTPKKSIIPTVTSAGDESKDVSDLGWEIYPEGVFDILSDIGDGLPIYITECGIASTNDDRRTRFLLNYLQQVYQAIRSGINIKGFFYWSLIDNFEWHRGFDPRFGLIEIDYATQKRTVRPSALVYKEIIKNNGIPHELLKLLGHSLNVESELKRL